MSESLSLLILAGLALCNQSPAADLVWENGRVRAVLGQDASWRALVNKTSGKDYCAVDKRIPVASVHVGDRSCRANRATLAHETLTLGFAGCDTQCVYRVTTTADWIAFQLQSISGARPSRMTLVSIGVTITERVGPILNAAWNDDWAICLRGINLQTHGQAARRRDFVELSTSSQDAPGPRLEGAGAALLAAPPGELRAPLSRLAVAYDLPRNDANGVASRDLPIARQSYWFLRFAEKDVDRVIDYCRLAGLRQVMMSLDSWCGQVGHYTFNTAAYPAGMESLRRTVGKLHEAGILVGMHTFVSKVSKTDAYVTPVPDRRFCVDIRATLAGDIGPADTAIRTRADLSQWPGSPVCRQKVWEGHVTKHQEVVIDDEIISYERIGPDGKWDTFEGCLRGAWKTRPAAHQTDADCRHYAVDGCINGYIVDLDSSLFDEMSSRLAEIFNDCQFDMVYFDGSEDVDKRRYNYYAAKAHAVAMRKFTKRPLIHQGGGFVNELWHSFTRDATVDQYPNTYLAYLHAGGSIDKWPTCKDHIDHSVRSVLRCADDMTPGELGWFGINPRSGQYDGLQYDEIEYLMAKSLALNAPISLQTGFRQMEAHPLTPDVLAIVRAYEELRLSGTTSPETAIRLGQLGKDFLLLRGRLRESAAVEFVEVHAQPTVAGAHDLRAFCGSRQSDSLATLWHYLGKEGTLLVDATRLEAYDVNGEPVPLDKTAAGTAIPLDHRRLTLRFPNLLPDAAGSLLAKARFEPRKPIVLWIPGAAFRHAAGNMARCSAVGLDDAEALTDAVLCSGKIDRSASSSDYCEYEVSVPRKGRWRLWARVRYPGGGDLSFGLVVPGDPVTLADQQVLGNCGLNKGQWHWTGRGGGSTSPPPGDPIILALNAGASTFRIYAREGGGTSASNPRLDCICLSEDQDYVPNDADARLGLTRYADP